MNYFERIESQVQALEKRSLEFLKNKPEISTEKLLEKIFELCYEIAKKYGDSNNMFAISDQFEKDSREDLVLNVLEGWYQPWDGRGSIGDNLRFSLVAQDAMFWSIYDYLKGDADRIVFNKCFADK